MQRPTTTYHKLVRDKIPAIIRCNGAVPAFRTAHVAELEELLVKKLLEEASELSEKL